MSIKFNHWEVAEKVGKKVIKPGRRTYCLNYIFTYLTIATIWPLSVLGTVNTGGGSMSW